jgi:hypothetical protein
MPLERYECRKLQAFSLAAYPVLKNERTSDWKLCEKLSFSSFSPWPYANVNLQAEHNAEPTS